MSTVISAIMPPPPLDGKGGIFAEKVFSVFSERVFWACFGIVMEIWEYIGITEKATFQM